MEQQTSRFCQRLKQEVGWQLREFSALPCSLYSSAQSVPEYSLLIFPKRIFKIFIYFTKSSELSKFAPNLLQKVKKSLKTFFLSTFFNSEVLTWERSDHLYSEHLHWGPRHHLSLSQVEMSCHLSGTWDLVLDLLFKDHSVIARDHLFPPTRNKREGKDRLTQTHEGS